MSNYGRVIHQTQVEQMVDRISEITNKPGFRASDWQAPITNFGRVLEKIRAGVPDKEISAAHPGWTGDVLRVCHKIVDGTISNPNDKLITDAEYERKEKHRKEMDKKRHAAYRKRYGKG